MGDSCRSRPIFAFLFMLPLSALNSFDGVLAAFPGLGTLESAAVSEAAAAHMRLFRICGSGSVGGLLSEKTVLSEG